MKGSLSKSEARTRLQQLRQAIDDYRYAYHVLDQTTISEAALDSLKHELQQLEEEWPELITPDSPSQRVAGEPLPAFKKVRHAVKMISLVDVFSPEELQAWDQRWRKLAPRTSTGFVADLKLDGLAVSLLYDQGQFVQAATRGDGQVGEDVTHNVKTIEAVPLRLRTEKLAPKIRQQVQQGRVEIRGEIVMSKKNFAALNKAQEKAGKPTFANPRNVSAGSIRQLDPAMTAARKLDFYAWELVTDVGQSGWWEAYQILKTLGIKVNPRAKLCATLDEVADFYAAMNKERESLPFWIDGVVVKIDQRKLYQQLGVVGKSPRAAVAWKFSAEEATTVVEDIVLQVGRTGALTPVAHLRPVQVAGTTVARATLHNADEITRLDVRVGDTVVIVKAGDIIPDIVQVLPQLRPKNTHAFRWPTTCPVCHQSVKRRSGEVAIYCTNRACPARQRENLYHFVSKKAFDIAGLGPSIIDVLMDEGLVTEPADLFRLKSSQLFGLPLFAEKKSDNLVTSIQAARRVTLDRFLYSLGIRHVGEQTALDVALHFGQLEKIMNAREGEIAAVANIGDVVARSVADFFADRIHRGHVKNLLRFVTIDPPPQPTSGGLSGKTVVVTGTLESLSRDEAHDQIRAAGGKVTSSVSAKTSYVVVGADPGSKATQAKKLGVTILTEADFLKLLKA